MKRTNIIVLTVFCCLLFLSSCSSSTKITINAKPETVFPLRDKPSLEIVKCGRSGSVTYNQSDDDYVGLTYSYDKEGKIIPFAFDYGRRGNAAAVFGNIGKAIAIAGVGIEGIGAIILAAGAEDVATPMFLAGLGIAGFGLSFGWPLDSRAEQKSYKYHYKYKRNQNTNQDLYFTQPEITLLDPPQNYYNERDRTNSQNERDITNYQNERDITIENNPTKADKDNYSDAAVSTKTLSELIKKRLSNNADRVTGKYVGTGSLTQDGVTIEKYHNISVTIVKVSNNVVGVNIVESNGDSFFASNLEYEINENGDGSYTLLNKKTKDAKIVISMNFLDFIHPRVNIEGNIYQLQINAILQK